MSRNGEVRERGCVCEREGELGCVFYWDRRVGGGLGREEGVGGVVV